MVLSNYDEFFVHAHDILVDFNIKKDNTGTSTES